MGSTPAWGAPNKNARRKKTLAFWEKFGYYTYNDERLGAPLTQTFIALILREMMESDALT